MHGGNSEQTSTFPQTERSFHLAVLFLYLSYCFETCTEEDIRTAAMEHLQMYFVSIDAESRTVCSPQAPTQMPLVVAKIAIEMSASQIISPVHVHKRLETRPISVTLSGMPRRRMFHGCSQCFAAPQFSTCEQVYWSCQNTLNPCLASNPWLSGHNEILISQGPAELSILGSSAFMNSRDS